MWFDDLRSFIEQALLHYERVVVVYVGMISILKMIDNRLNKKYISNE